MRRQQGSKAGSSGTIDIIRKGPVAPSRLFPELALFETDQERREVIWRYWREHVGRRQRRLYLAALLSGSAIAMALSVVAVKRVLASCGLQGEGWVGGVIAGVYPLAVAIGSQYLVRKLLIRYLREQLVAKGVPICIYCGYDLRGQVDPRCPECGKAFDPNLIRPTEDPAAGPSD